MQSDEVHNSPIPWSRPAEWMAAQRSIHFHIHRFRHLREALEPLAGRIEADLCAIGSLMEWLGAHTCSFCPQPCCLTARVWYDFRDLLRLQVSGKSIPEGQPITDYAGKCRYVSHRGCRLSRPLRPWICTWYLCPVQKRRLERQPGGILERLTLAMEEIKTRRVLLEERFVAAVSR